MKMRLRNGQSQVFSDVCLRRMGRSTRRTFDCSPSCRTTPASARPSSAAASACPPRRSRSGSRRLERDGAIAGYRADVDPRALGYTLAAVLRMRPAPRQIPKVAEIARDTPEVVECHRVTGEDCFYMKLHVRSVEHLEEVIDRFTPYGQTTTSIIQSSPCPRRGVELWGPVRAACGCAGAGAPRGRRPAGHLRCAPSCAS